VKEPAPGPNPLCLGPPTPPVSPSAVLSISRGPNSRAPAHSTLFPFLFLLWRLHVGPLCQPSFFFPWRTEVRWLSAPYSSWIRCNATGGSWDPAAFSGFMRGLFRTPTMCLHQKTPLAGDRRWGSAATLGLGVKPPRSFHHAVNLQVMRAGSFSSLIW
jgi:hypothetical protein